MHEMYVNVNTHMPHTHKERNKQTNKEERGYLESWGPWEGFEKG